MPYPNPNYHYALTYSIPHNNVDISAESVGNMLSDVKIHKVTKMMVHIDT